MSEFASNVSEYNKIGEEIDRARLHLKTLRARHGELGDWIKEFLVKTEKPGVKVDGKSAIVIQERQARQKQTAEEKKGAIDAVLSNYGIQNGQRLLQELEQAKKGAETTVTCIKRIPIKDGNIATVPKKKK